MLLGLGALQLQRLEAGMSWDVAVLGAAEGERIFIWADRRNRDSAPRWGWNSEHRGVEHGSQAERHDRRKRETERDRNGQIVEERIV
jgi:hypothetical protein